MILFRWKKAIKFRGSHSHSLTQTHTISLSLAFCHKNLSPLQWQNCKFSLDKNHGINFMQILEIIRFIGILKFAFYIRRFSLHIIFTNGILGKYSASMALEYPLNYQIKLIRSCMKFFPVQNWVWFFYLYI